MFEHEIEIQKAVFGRLADLDETIVQVSECIAEVMAAGGRLVVCADPASQGVATDFVVCLNGQGWAGITPFEALALTDPPNQPSAQTGSEAFWLSRRSKIADIGQPGDILVLIESVSCATPGAHLVVEAAYAADMITIALFPGSPDSWREECNFVMPVPNDGTLHEGVAQVFILRYICQRLRKNIEARE